MLFKKVLATAMAATMIFAATVPASAGSLNENGQLDKPIGGDVEAPTLSVKLPLFSDESIIFDVYNQTGTGKQIISQDFVFENNSTVPVEVSLASYAYDFGTIAPNPAALATDAHTGDDKTVFFWLNEAEKTAAGDMTRVDSGTDFSFEYPAFGAQTAFVLDAADSDSVTADAGAKFTVLERGTIMRGDFSASDPVDFWRLGSKNEMVFRLDGTLNPGASWVEGDSISFTPVFNVKPDVYIAKPEITSDAYTVAALTADTPIALTITGDVPFDPAVAIGDFNITYDPDGFDATALDTVPVALSNAADGDNELTLTFDVPTTLVVGKPTEGKIFIQAKEAAYTTEPDDPSNVITVYVGSYRPQISTTVKRLEAAAIDTTTTIEVKSDTPFASTTIDGTHFTFTHDGTPITKSVTFSADRLTATVKVDAALTSPAAGDVISLSVAGAAFAPGAKASNALEITLFSKVQLGNPTVTAANPASDFVTTNTGSSPVMTVTFDRPLKDSVASSGNLSTLMAAADIKVKNASTTATSPSVLTRATYTLAADRMTLTITSLKFAAVNCTTGSEIQVLPAAESLTKMFDENEVITTGLTAGTVILD